MIAYKDDIVGQLQEGFEHIQHISNMGAPVYCGLFQLDIQRLLTARCAELQSVALLKLVILQYFGGYP